MTFEFDLHFADTAYVCLRDHCLDGLSRERVGLLFGTGNTVLHSAPLENIATGPDRFHIRGVDIAALKRTFAPLTVLGRYHTHPANVTTPSAQDRATLPAGWLEVIVCVALADATVEGSKPTIAALNAYDGRQIRHRIELGQAAA